MSSENPLALKDEWEALDTEFKDLEVHQKQFSKTVDELSKCQNLCTKSVIHQWYRLNQISEALSNTKEEKVLMESLTREIDLRKVQLEDIQSVLPRNNGMYLQIILGSVNVTIMNKEDSMKYKEEYERFKLTVTVIILILSAQSILFSYRVLDALLHFLLVWYYCTLTIRESILVVNGSRPDGLMYDLFRRQFTLYTCYTSILQFLQFKYQQGCLYRLRALGERHKMDITIEGFHSWMWRGLSFLLPFLYFGYVFQLYNAYTLYNLSNDEKCVEWQVCCSAIIFFCVSQVGNTFTTSCVLHQKLTEKINSMTFSSETEMNSNKSK